MLEATKASEASVSVNGGKKGGPPVKSKPRKQVFSLVEEIHSSEAASISSSSPPPLHKLEVGSLSLQHSD